MSLTYNSRVIADIRVMRISGLRGVGCYQLRLSLEFNVPSWGANGEKISLSTARAEIAVSANPSLYKLLGYAEPEVPLSFETGNFTQQQSPLFLLNLTQQQLFALENLRQGGGLYFQVTVNCEARGSNGVQIAREELRYEATLSEWSCVLRELDYAEVLVIGIELPRTELEDKLRPAVDLVRQAHGDLIGGRYDSVVSRCRQALESVRTVLGQKEDLNSAIEKFCKGRNSMTKHERELLIGATARHYTHLAHHVNDEGVQEWYSRGDATFLLALTAAVISSEVARATDHALGRPPGTPSTTGSSYG